MNFKVYCALLALFVFARNIPTGDAIACYQCEELSGKVCDLNVRKVLTENCTDTFVCAKYLWTENATSTIHRRCAPHTICEEQKALTTANRTLSFCDTCNTTLCNSGTNLSISVVTVLLSFCAFLKSMNVL